MQFKNLMCLIVAVCLAPPALTAGVDEREMQLAETMLIDASLRFDLVGLNAVRERFEALVEDVDEKEQAETASRLFTDLALVEWNRSMALAIDPEASRDAAVRMHEHLTDAVRIDPDNVEALAWTGRALYMRFTTGSLSMQEGAPLMTETHARSKALNPEHPLVLLNDGIYNYYTPGSPHKEKGIAVVRATAGALRNSTDLRETYWRLLMENFLSQMLIGEGQMVAARRVIDAILDERPDYYQVRETVRPMTELVARGVVPDFDERSWNVLGDDPAGDSAAPGLPDVRRLAYAYDADANWVWFRFELESGVDATSIGVNIPVDIDNDQSNGANWWGGNTAFKYDRLVSLWVVLSEDGEYRGTAGVGDTTGVTQGRYANLHQGEVSFSVDEEGETIYVGFPLNNLTSDRSFSLIGVVGSSVQWSDAIRDEGFYSIDLDS